LVILTAFSQKRNARLSIYRQSQLEQASKISRKKAAKAIAKNYKANYHGSLFSGGSVPPVLIWHNV